MNNSQKIRRREFLQVSALGIAGASLGLAGCATQNSASNTKAKIPVGVQLYSVREDCKKD